MIWDYIRDFIVQYITGGYTSSADYYPVTLGNMFNADGDPITDTEQLVYSVGHADNGTIAYANIGDWLATTLTIICMCAIVFFAYWLVRWIFKAVSSAFLLRR